MIIDLKQEQIVIYINDDASGQFKKLSEKMLGNDVYKGIKSVLSFKEYKSLIGKRTFESNEDVTAYDYMFSYLDKYEERIQRKDVLPNLKLQLDYHLYNELETIQEVFDSPKINIDKKILPLIFPNIPENLNFPLMYRLYSIHGTTENFDTENLSEAEVDEMIKEGLNHTLKNETIVQKVIERKISKKDISIDLSNYHETDPGYVLRAQKRLSSGAGFGDD